jgi:hypothetical protein
MRKKQHKYINPELKQFDKYYMINYLVPNCISLNYMKKYIFYLKFDYSKRKWAKTGKK